MKRYSGGFLRIAFFIMRSTKLTREWFRGTMLYTRHNPKWFVRVFELGNGRDEELLDFGTIRPDGIIACGVPVRFLQRFFHKRGMDNIPMMAFPQEPYPHIGTVHFNSEEIAQKAIDLFKRRGCCHVAYVGTHLPNGIRLSRHFANVFAAEAKAAEVGCTIFPRKVYSSIGIRISECDGIMEILKKLPKPCGILTYDDGIGRDVLDLCRLAKINVPGSAYVLGMDDNDVICDNAYPTLSSIQIDYERTAFLAARALDEMIAARRHIKILPRLMCGFKGITERASTQDPRGTGRLVALACDYIAKNACRPGGLDQHDIAQHLGVSVRTLQMRFKETSITNSILTEIQRVQLANVCRLLATTDRSITDITFAAGFGSLSRLKAIFQKKYKMSMRDYRKIAKNSTPPPLKDKNKAST